MRHLKCWSHSKGAFSKDKDLRQAAKCGEGAGFSVCALLIFAAGGVSVAEALNDETVVSRVKPYALSLGIAGNEGLLSDGSMRYEKLPDGTFDDSRQWWVQAETVVGNLWLWKYHRVASGYDVTLKAWDYILKNLVDREGGEWWWAVLPDGTLDKANPKAGFWKCPACLFFIFCSCGWFRNYRHMIM